MSKDVLTFNSLPVTLGKIGVEEPRLRVALLVQQPGNDLLSSDTGTALTSGQRMVEDAGEPLNLEYALVLACLYRLDPLDGVLRNINCSNVVRKDAIVTVELDGHSVSAPFDCVA